MLRARLLTCSALLVLAAGTARAEYVYTFDSSTYTAAPGSTVTANVYLLGTGGDASELYNYGLLAAGIGIHWSAGNPAPSQLAYVASPSDIIPNSAVFDDTPSTEIIGPDQTAHTAGFSEDINNSNGGAGGAYNDPPANTSYQILLGSFIFTVGNTVGDKTVISLYDLNPGSTDTLTNAGTSVDDTNPGYGSAVIKVAGAAVPEPSSLVLLATGGLCLLARARIRRRPARAA